MFLVELWMQATVESRVEGSLDKPERIVIPSDSTSSPPVQQSDFDDKPEGHSVELASSQSPDSVVQVVNTQTSGPSAPALLFLPSSGPSKPARHQPFPRTGSSPNSFSQLSFSDGLNPNANLYVANLPGNFVDEDLKALFLPFGHILRCVVKNMGNPRAYGFVQFGTVEEAHKAIYGMRF